MAPGSRRSTLQTEILSILAAGPVDTISTLAVSLEKSRPAVSRSISKLIEAGLVKKQGRTLHLTEDGSRETEAAAESLRTSTKKLAWSTDRKLRAFTSIHERLVRDQMNLWNAMPSVAEFAINPAFIPDSITLGTIPSFVDDLSSIGLLGMDPSRIGIAAFAGLEDRAAEAASAATRIGGLSDSVAEMAGINVLVEEAAVSASSGTVSRMSELADSVIGFATSDFTASDAVGAFVQDFAGPTSVVTALASQWQPLDIASLATPIISAQNAYASILDEIAGIGGALSLGAIADQSQLLSSTLGAVMDVAGYYTPEVNATGIAIDPDLLMVPAHLAAISTSLAGVFEDSFESLQRPDHLPISVLSDRLHISTLPVSHYAEFGRHILSPEESDHSDGYSAGSQHDKRLGLEELDVLLVQLNPAFVDKRQGAWLSYYGDNPDRLAQAAGSLRELLTMVLHHLAPNALPSDPKNKSATRKDRVRSIMRGSKSTTKHTLAVSDAVETGYDLLCKHLHTIQHDDLALRAYMYSVESTMLMMLSKPERRSS